VRLYFLPHGGDANHSTDLDPKSAMARMRKQNHATLLCIRSLIAQTGLRPWSSSLDLPELGDFRRRRRPCARAGAREIFRDVRGRVRGPMCYFFFLLRTVVLTYGWHR
jgi:hypothetical protein